MHATAGARTPWLWIAAAVVATDLVLVAASFGWVAIYSHLIRPGQTLVEYQAHARHASPIVALTLGAPIFFWLGRRLARRGTGGRYHGAWALWMVTAAIDVPMWLVAGGSLVLFLVAQSVHLGAALAGARSAKRPLLAAPEPA